MSKEALLVYQNREDNSYIRKEILGINEKFSEDYINEAAKNYNNEAHDEYVKVYYDDLLCEMTKQLGSSELFNNCVLKLKDICSSIECDIDDLYSWNDTIADTLKDLSKEEQ